MLEDFSVMRDTKSIAWVAISLEALFLVPLGRSIIYTLSFIEKMVDVSNI